MAVAHVWPEGLAGDGEFLTAGATLEKPDGARWRLWYRLPAAQRAAVSTGSDSFVLGVLFRAMETGTDLRVHGAVSPSLLGNLVEFQRAWHCWRPEVYRPVEISADVEREETPAAADDALMGFSGGVDSAFTAWSSRPGGSRTRRTRLAAGMMVHGFDIPLSDPEAFARAADKSARMLSSVGMELHRVATNFREQGGDWEDAHAAALASCLSLLRGRYRRGVIASCYPYPALILPYGSNPVTDPMLSSDSFRIVHDGAETAKVEKVRAIASWPEARQLLRVCWQGPHGDRNCCRCQKCVWTMLVFRMVGGGLPECFERDITDAEIRRLRYPDAGSVNSSSRLVTRARADGVSASWVAALQLSVVFNRLRLAVKKVAPDSELGRRVYRFFLPPP